MRNELKYYFGEKKVEYNTEQCQFAKFSSTCTSVPKIFIAYFGSVFGKVIKCLNNDIYGTFTAVKFDLNNMYGLNMYLYVHAQTN